MNIQRKGPGLTWKILAAMLCVVFLSLACVGVISSVEMRRNVVDTAIDDLMQYGLQLAPFAANLIEDRALLMYKWDIKSQAGVSGIMIIDLNGDVLYPQRIKEISDSDILKVISQDFVPKVLAGNNYAEIARDKTTEREFLLVGMPIWDNAGKVAGATILSRPLLEVLNLSNTLTSVMLVSSVFSLGAAVLIGILLSKRITKPIIRLKDAAVRMAKGDLDVRCEVKNRDEIGMLGQGFNYLGSELSQTIKELDEKNKKLEHDMDEVAKLEEMRKNYIANVSHEFRAPITGIRGFVEPLMDGIIDTPEERAESYRIIYGETLRLERLIDNMLDLSRLQSGKAQIELEKLDVTGIIKSVAGRFGERCAKKRMALKLDIEEGLPLVMGSEDRIDQVLVILIDNAIKYTQEGGEVCVFASKGEDEVTLGVRDNGPGIREEDLPYVFERFYKGDKSRSEAGTGLGLAIAKEIVTLLNGGISVKSEPGFGAQFEFTLKTAGGEK